jgi:hypothetical protein
LQFSRFGCVGANTFEFTHHEEHEAPSFFLLPSTGKEGRYFLVNFVSFVVCSESDLSKNSQF